MILIFQSTPSAWRETNASCTAASWSFISIHSLRVEGDKIIYAVTRIIKRFQSTPSAWRETRFLLLHSFQPQISIHSLRVEGDNSIASPNSRCIDFNPLPPRGGRLGSRIRYTVGILFQSTPSAWRETSATSLITSPYFISIHSLRVEGDEPCSQSAAHFIDFNPLPPRGGRPMTRALICGSIKYFNPLPPRGGRRLRDEMAKKHREISIHSLRVEGDSPLFCTTRDNRIFQSTPSAWRETASYGRRFDLRGISIHSLRVEGDRQCDKIIVVR